jgi:hypothetical protein
MDGNTYKHHITFIYLQASGISAIHQLCTVRYNYVYHFVVIYQCVGTIIGTIVEGLASGGAVRLNQRAMSSRLQTCCN